MITHVVLLQLADPAHRDETLQRLRAMVGQVPSLRSLRCAADTVGNAGSSDVILITEHDDEAGLSAYANDPIHQEFIAWVKPLLTGRAAVDTSDLT